MDDGDFDRVAVENGEAAPEKDSKPVRLESELGGDFSLGLKIEDEDSPGADERGGRDREEGDLTKGEGEEGVCLPEENMFWPLTEAKGELVEAYAMNPPYR